MALRSRIGCLVVLGTTLSAVDIGETAPALSSLEWIGNPSTSASHAGMTVLVLWSPTDPSYRAILPRMSDLQARHPEARIIGVSSADPALVEQVVSGLGSKATIAQAHAGQLAPFMPPVGLPCAVLMDASGTVLWWGHPLDAPVPVVQAIEGRLRVEIPQEALNHEPLPSPSRSPMRRPERQSSATPAPPPRGAEVRREVEVVVVEPGWMWTWSVWPVPFEPICLPAPRIIMPLLPPFWRWRH